MKKKNNRRKHKGNKTNTQETEANEEIETKDDVVANTQEAESQNDNEAQSSSNTNDIDKSKQVNYEKSDKKEGESTVKQDKENEEIKRLKKKLNDKLGDIEKLKTQEKHDEIYELLLKTVKIKFFIIKVKTRKGYRTKQWPT